jgi:glutamate 5-kinase
MLTKIKAAKEVTKNGIDMVIANGSNPDILYDIVEGNAVCTRFLGVKK